MTELKTLNVYTIYFNLSLVYFTFCLKLPKDEIGSILRPSVHFLIVSVATGAAGTCSADIVAAAAIRSHSVGVGVQVTDLLRPTGEILGKTVN